MPGRHEWLTLPLADRLARLKRTPDDVAVAIRGRGDEALSAAAEPGAWSAKDVVCHLRDIEELVILRFHLMLASDDPKVFVVGAPPRDAERWGISPAVPFPLDPDRWRRERQYARNDAQEALAAFGRRRREVLALLDGLSPEQWQRGSIHPEHGRVTFADWLAGVAAHDDNHLAQLQRALPPSP
ncbi:MAG TPA: DinB family protein [Dehalococcoidia bacterium]|nr:DinB family protein [Dehalococcoidia bacterium]